LERVEHVYQESKNGKESFSMTINELFIHQNRQKLRKLKMADLM